MRFAIGAYFADRGQSTFYPEVVIPFTLDDADAHYHVPLLLSPYAYSTYRTRRQPARTGVFEKRRVERSGAATGNPG